MTLSRPAYAIVFALVSTAGFAAQSLSMQPATQGSVASKTAKFGTVSASSAAVKKALSSKDLKGGAKMVGKAGSFTGLVDVAYEPKSHKDVYIDFSKPWKNTISAHVRAADFAKFPVLTTLNGKQVLVTGKFSLNSGHPEIVLTSVSQLKLVK
jgi:hypothetical protein